MRPRRNAWRAPLEGVSFALGCGAPAPATRRPATAALHCGGARLPTAVLAAEPLLRPVPSPRRPGS